jgi:hypothetical protein
LCAPAFEQETAPVMAAWPASTWRRGLLIAVTNPSEQPLLVGASLRPATWRFRLEGDLFVRVSRRTTRAELLPSNQDVLVVTEPRETAMLLIPINHPPKRQMQAVIAMGQQNRLRVVHRRVTFPTDLVDKRRHSRMRFITDRETIFAETSGGARQP